eukprot:TRINITY_DN1270_c0_g1_i4.p1 TRINITY_DN1270_c0_g1~~TRINITY_DN1270_c0_g1_i4.p1  ORF type:complete len:635 (-),score=100.22 TRINITY_DN1270_c0_g1_i4:301-2205(-)
MQHGQEESEEWRGKVMVRADELEVGQKIAEGKYGTVYKGKCRGQSVAIKILHNQHLSNEKLEELRTEVEIMSRLRHPCILLLMGVCTDKDKIALVMEYVEGKSLDRILHDSKINLSLQTQLHIAKDIAKGMNWLHCLDPPIIHRDIKPPNILVNASYDVKVCDFGLSCVKEIPKPDEELRDTAVGSPIWMAPEVLSGHLASEKSDVYAFAIVLWEIMTRKSPFSNVRSFDEFLDDVIDNHKRPPLPDDMDANLKKLIEECWSGNAKKRPNFSEILDRLDDILINMLIKDAKGKELWRSMKNKEYLGEHYPFFAAFSCFNEQLCKTLGLSKNEEANLSGHHGYACFKIIIGEYYHSLYSTADSVKVTCESWGKFVDTFGPLESGMGLFNRLEELCSKQWFHGAISSEDAEKRLKTGGAQDPDKKKVQTNSNNTTTTQQQHTTTTHNNTTQHNNNNKHHTPIRVTFWCVCHRTRNRASLSRDSTSVVRSCTSASRATRGWATTSSRSTRTCTATSRWSSSWTTSSRSSTSRPRAPSRATLGSCSCRPTRPTATSTSRSRRNSLPASAPSKTPRGIVILRRPMRRLHRRNRLCRRLRRKRRKRRKAEEGTEKRRRRKKEGRVAVRRSRAVVARRAGR